MITILFVQPEPCVHNFTILIAQESNIHRAYDMRNTWTLLEESGILGISIITDGMLEPGRCDRRQELQRELSLQGRKEGRQCLASVMV